MKEDDTVKYIYIYGFKKVCSQPAVILLLYICMFSGCSSGVERNLAKVDVARSNRVTRF